MAGAGVYRESERHKLTFSNNAKHFILIHTDARVMVCALLFAELIKGGSGAVKMWSVPTSSSLLLLLLGWCQLLRTHTLAL